MKYKKMMILIKKFHLRKFKNSIFRIFFIISLISLISLISIGYIYLNNIDVFNLNKNTLSPILNWKPEKRTLFFDNEGKKIGQSFSRFKIYTPIDKIPPLIIKTLIAVEDKNFWTHYGIDLKAILRASFIFIKNGFNKPKQGGSTLTQQVVRHFLLSKEKTIERKIKEIVLSFMLEKYVSKKRILEIYLNELFLGQGSYGMAAAAKRYFDKNLIELETHEIALLVGLFQLPTKYNPLKRSSLAKKRQKTVLRSMIAQGELTREEAIYWNKKELKYKPYTYSAKNEIGYFLDYVSHKAFKYLGRTSLKSQGYKIFTTFDANKHELAVNAIRQNGANLKKYENSIQMSKKNFKIKKGLEAALIATTAKTGEIICMIGGRNYSKSSFNRAFQANRQPGSSFKPIIYSLALQEGRYWNDIIYVSPITLAGHYRPRSQLKNYMTKTTLIRAFYRSMNAPTMEIGQKIGLDKIINHAKNLGITSSIKKEFGTLLGSSGVTMLDLVRVYGTFANDGVRIDPIAITKIIDKNDEIVYVAPTLKERSKRILSKQINFMIVQAMQQVFKRGTAKRAKALSSWSAGKTGTSNQSKDNWFSGFTNKHIAISWVGYDNSYPLLDNAQGATLALPIWKSFIEKTINRKKDLKGFKRPKGVLAFRVNPKNGKKSSNGIIMWFEQKNLPTFSYENKQYKSNKLGVFRDPLFNE